MHLSFYTLAVVTACVFSAITITWMFAPTRFLTPWGVGSAAATSLVGRRAAALYAGMAVMFFIARYAEPSITRDALVDGLISTCLILVLLGIYELLSHQAGKGILVAVLIELVLSLLWWQVV